MDDLYREEILEHYKRPHNWGQMDEPDLQFSDNNPLCGDELTVMLRVDGDGQRALLAGDEAEARERMAEAADLYRQSWEVAPPRAFGRSEERLHATNLFGSCRKSATAPTPRPAAISTSSRTRPPVHRTTRRSVRRGRRRRARAVRTASN